METFQNISLKSFHTFGIDVTTQFLYKIESKDDIKKLIDESVCKGNFVILGKGSNVLFSKPFQGSVIVNCIRGIELISESKNEVVVRVGAGEDWDEFVEYCVDKNWYGIENLSLIPGSVGAAAVQNIGAYGAEASQTIDRVETIDTKTGKTKIVSKSNCKFGYRSSYFKSEQGRSLCITHVHFRLKKNSKLHISYSDIEKEIELQKILVSHLSLRELRTIICKIRNQKLPNVSKIGNAGSFFMNPVVDKKIFDSIQQSYPELKAFETNIGFKLSAGWLIEKAGFKGWTAANKTYGVFPKHALVLVNYGEATGAEIKELAESIQKKVFEEFHILLVPEVIYLS